MTMILGEASPTKFVEVLPKLKIQWDTPMVCGLIIQINKVRAMNPALRTQVGKKGVIGCQYFQIEVRIGFIGLLFATEGVPDSYIEI